MKYCSLDSTVYLLVCLLKITMAKNTMFLTFGSMQYSKMFRNQLLKNSKTIFFSLLHFRIITKTGMQNLIQHSMSEKLHPTNLKNGNNKSDTEDTSTISLTSLQTMFDPTSYRSVHNLATNSDKRNFEGKVNI